jgi:16S rRNA (guanine966-N2)-methyltransferase
MFNILLHAMSGNGGENGGAVKGARALDLFCGSGALGLEALSRGAQYALLIDNDREAIACARANIAALGLEEQAAAWRRNALRRGRRGTGSGHLKTKQLTRGRTGGAKSEMEPFDLVFLDPPYGRGLAEKAIQSALAGGWLAKGALCVIEERAGHEPELPEAFTKLDERRHGDSSLTFWRLETPPS